MTTTNPQTAQPSIDEEVTNYRHQYYATNPTHTAEQAAAAARAYRRVWWRNGERRVGWRNGVAAWPRPLRSE